MPGFTNPSASELSSANIKKNANNLVVISSHKGALQINADFFVATADKINLNFAAQANEVFTFQLRATEAISEVISGKPFAITGTLTTGEVDIPLGQAFDINYNSTEQIGQITLKIDGVQMFRNVNNVTAAPLADGNYEEVAGGGAGKTNLLRLNESFPQDVSFSVESLGPILDTNNTGLQQRIESVEGQLDQLIPTVAELADVDETEFQAGPNNIDLKAFADKLYQACRDISSIQTELQRLDDYVPVTIQKSASCGSYAATGAFAQITNISLLATVSEGESVEVSFEGDAGTDQNGWFFRNSGDPANAHIEVRILRNGIEVQRDSLRHQVTGAGDQFTYLPAGSISFKDTPGAGSWTYSAEMVLRTGSDGGARNFKMVLKKNNIIG